MPPEQEGAPQAIIQAQRSDALQIKQQQALMAERQNEILKTLGLADGAGDVKHDDPRAELPNATKHRKGESGKPIVEGGAAESPDAPMPPTEQAAAESGSATAAPKVDAGVPLPAPDAKPEAWQKNKEAGIPQALAEFEEQRKNGAQPAGTGGKSPP